MTSNRIPRVVTLGCSLLFVCFCAVMSYYLLDGSNIQCRIRSLIINTDPAQARFTELQRAFTSAMRDELLSEDRSREQIEVHIGELYCGCAYGDAVYVYRSQESATEVLERFARDISVPGWRVRYSNADRVEYRNPENTVEATIRIRSKRQRIPTVYEVAIIFAEPSLPNCYEIGE